MHKQVEKSVSQGLDVDALAVKVLLMSHQTPKLYILRQTESESIKCLSSIEKPATLNRDKALSRQNHDAQSTNKYRTITAAGAAPPELLQLT